MKWLSAAPSGILRHLKEKKNLTQKHQLKCLLQLLIFKPNFSQSETAMVATSFDEIIAADLKNLKEKDANNLGKYLFDTPILIDWHGFLPTTSRNRFDPGQAQHTY